MKWLRIGLSIIVLLLTILITLPVLADTSQDVTVTATGYICEAPGGFTLTYISDYEVGISWTKGEDAENTMIRAKYGSYPVDREDGYQVYYGDGTVASDTGVNFDEGVSDVYYIAFSQNASGAWEDVGSSNFMENPHMLLIALIILALGFTIVSYIFKKGMLAFAGAGAWMVASIYCFTKSAETWDIYFSLAFLFIGLLLACMFSPLAWRETTTAGERTEDPDAAEMRAEMAEFNRGRNQFSFLHSNRRPRRRTRW